MKQNKTQNSIFLRYTFALFLLLCLVVSPALPVQAATNKIDAPSATTDKVYVIKGGKKSSIVVNGKTNVDVIIRRMGITLGELDVVEPALSAPIKAGDTIRIIRREKVTETLTKVIPHETVYRYSTEIPTGTTEVIVTGQDGYGKQTYERLLEDGNVVSETLIATNYTTPPVTEEVAIGFFRKPTSSFDFAWDFNEQGEPVNTVQVYRKQKSTAYTARPNSMTASGRDAMVGHVAVNPNEIPYGSKLFIQGSDGTKLLYGYAIAADTGTALLDGRSDIDLYFDTMAECIEHGVKYVDIFVLETPSQ